MTVSKANGIFKNSGRWRLCKVIKRSCYTASFLKKRLGDLFIESGVQLAYFFGSQVRGKVGPMSDVDLAILWSNYEKEPMMKSLKLQSEIRELLKDERIEVGPLNEQTLSFCYNVIRYGVCIFGREEDRVRYETYILNEYLDFLYLADEYNRVFKRNVLKGDEGIGR